MGDRKARTASGYRMPAEWDRHRATWIAWPHYRPDWEGKVATVHWDYVEIVRHLVEGEEVRILVPDRKLEKRARRMLGQGDVDLEHVFFHRVETNRSWLRDSGPIFVTRRSRRAGGSAGTADRIAVTDWKFSGWARYPNWKRDDCVPARVAKIRGLSRIVPRLEQGGHQRIVLEGGSIDVDGAGTLLTTEECLLGRRQERNPGLTRVAMEAVLRTYLGVRKTLWLGGGIAGDDTHGHVDDVARFAGPATVAAAVEDDTSDVNHEPLRDNLSRLKSMTDARGRKLNVVAIPMPRPLLFCGDRLPASYLNFYIANHAVLVPTFNDPADRVALERIASLFPNREVVGIHALNLVVGQGTLHCLTQQEPR